jgi:hypothetical protein
MALFFATIERRAHAHIIVTFSTQHPFDRDQQNLSVEQLADEPVFTSKLNTLTISLTLLGPVSSLTRRTILLRQWNESQDSDQHRDVLYHDPPFFSWHRAQISMRSRVSLELDQVVAIRRPSPAPTKLT